MMDAETRGRGGWTSQGERTEVRAAESRIAFVAAGLLSVAVGLTLAYVYVLFRPLAPPRALDAWASAMAVWTVTAIAVPIVVGLRRPSHEETVRVWALVGKAVAIAFDLLIAASVWLLLPHAPESLQILMVVFYAAAICGQAIATAESLGTILFGIVSVFGSTAWYFANSGGAYGLPLAIFILGFAALLVGAAVVIRNGLRAALRARREAVEAAQKLADALAAAEAERDAKARFVAAATHDLRQPLQAAALYFAPLGADPGEGSRARAVAGLGRALTSADALLDDVLLHLRIDARAISPTITDVPLGPVLDQVRAVHAAGAAERGVALDVVPSSAVARADAVWLERAVVNLVCNALRHSDGRRILLGVRPRGARVEVWCLDDGRGVAAEDHARIFAEYVRGLDARARGTAGLGLGLASARRMMTAMDGAIRLEPRWRGGALFVLDAPRAHDLPETRR